MTTEAACALCGQKASVETRWQTDDNKVVRDPCYGCPQCGRYVLGQMMVYELENNKDLAFRLTCMIRWHRVREAKEALLGIFRRTPKSETPDQQQGTVLSPAERYVKKLLYVDDILRDFPRPDQMIDRAMLNLERCLGANPMDYLSLKWGQLEHLLYCPGKTGTIMLRYMADMGLIGHLSSTSDGAMFGITPAGWDRLRDLRQVGAESKQAFVAMAFSPETDAVYDDGIRPAVEANGYRCMRIDQEERNDKVCDAIITEIRRSRFLLADFTGQRNGVYFEAAFALGLGLPIIWMVSQVEVDKLHFDTRQYAHIVYKDPQDLRERLEKRIGALIV